MKALVINTEGDTETKDFSDNDLLDEFQKEVGGYVEVVNTEGFSIWFNEDGLSLNLPLNSFASWLLSPWTGGGLVGNVIVTGPEKDGEPTDVPEKVEAQAINLAKIAKHTKR
jgi:hypothetical protein